MRDSDDTVRVELVGDASASGAYALVTQTVRLCDAEQTAETLAFLRGQWPGVPDTVEVGRTYKVREDYDADTGSIVQTLITIRPLERRGPVQ